MKDPSNTNVDVHLQSLVEELLFFLQLLLQALDLYLQLDVLKQSRNRWYKSFSF